MARWLPHGIEAGARGYAMRSYYTSDQRMWTLL